jgi:Fe-S-cluster containining protein
MNQGARAAGRRLLPLYRDVDRVVEAAAKAEDASCRRGCAHCCYNLAGVSLLEALPIAEYLLTSDAWKPRLPELLVELARQDRIIEDLGGVNSHNAMRYQELNIPCVFLKKNRDCGIYNLRPMVCRTYVVVTDPIHCSPAHSGDVVGAINFFELSIEFWLHTSLAEAKEVPTTMDSLQRVVLVAMELLQRDKEDFREWLKTHPQIFVDEMVKLKQRV